MASRTAPAGHMLAVSLTVNGTLHELQIDTRTSLLDLLRETLDLTGSKKGCDHGQCGACTVLIGGRRANACLTLAVTLDNTSITTIEGLADDDGLNPLQKAFIENDAFQCGYCTPGQICSGTGMLAEAAAGWPSSLSVRSKGPIELDDAEIAERMSGNICRCGAYPGIRAALREVAEGIA